MKPIVLHVKNDKDMGELADILYESKYKMDYREKKLHFT